MQLRITILFILMLPTLTILAQEKEQVIPFVAPAKEGVTTFQVDDPSIYCETKLVYLKNIKASEVEPFIQSRLSKFGKVQVNDEMNMLIITDREPKLSDLTTLAKKLDEIGKKEFLRLETEVVPLKYIKASSILGIAQQRLSADGTVQANDDLNVLIITDIRSKIDAFKQIIKDLDIPAKQVMVEVKIMRIEKTKGMDAGIDISSVFSGDLLRDFHYEKHKDKYDAHESTTSRYWYSFETPQLDTVINTLLKKGYGKIITSQHIVVLNNKEGEIQTGIEWGHWYSPQTILLLKVKPQIGVSDLITLDVTASLGKIIERERRGYYDSPGYVIYGEKVTSTVILNEGKTFVISGLRRKDYEVTTRKFPILGDILPFIFSKKIRTAMDTELLIFITPHILDIEKQGLSKEEVEKIEKEFK